MPNLDNQVILLAFVAVTALAVLLQAIVLLAIYVSLRKATRSLHEETDGLRSMLMPVIQSTQEFLTNSQELLATTRGFVAATRDLVARIAPKADAAAADLSEAAQVLRKQTAEVEFTAREILDRVRMQTARLDGMTSGALDSVDRAGAFLAGAVSKPVRQLVGVVAAAKAIVESLRASESAPPKSAHPADEDPFA
jgi:uncharacterized protein YoxC